MQIRKAMRDCECRGCYEKLPKGTAIFHTHSYINRGTTVILCMTCVDLLVAMREVMDDKNLANQT